jgi:hypothetical protein
MYIASLLLKSNKKREKARITETTKKRAPNEIGKPKLIDPRREHSGVQQLAKRKNKRAVNVRLFLFLE